MQNTYNQLLEETKSKILAILDIKPENQWTLESNKDGYVVYSKENPENGLKIYRTETNALVDLEQFVSVYFDFTKRKEYDQNFQEGTLIEKVDANTNIYYARGKAPAILVDPRDFCHIGRVEQLGEGHIMSISKSIEHQKVPPVKGFQRGEIVFQGLIVKKLPNGQTNIILISNVDPKGDIPKALVNHGGKYQVEGLQKVLEYINKQGK